MAPHYLENLLSEKEKILHTARQHWFVLSSMIFFEIAAILLIFGVTATVASFVPVAGLVIIIGAILVLIPIATMTRDILIWANHQYIVTNRRVIQLSGVINKSVTDSSLEKVNDVHMTQSFFGRIFNYGDVEILTASELGANLFKRIEEPVKFKTAMLNAKENLERGEEAGLAVQAAPDIPSLISKLDQLRQQGVVSEEEFTQKKGELLAKM